MNIITQLIGYSAAIVGTSLMLPQIFKTIKTNKVEDISLMMLVFYFLNCLLWLIYGLLIKDLPITIANFIALIISIIQLTLKYRYN